ncbi:MAG: hypothetical protein K0S47_1492 [Herbinix sp.]|jgi:competence protein ComEA|nr:hypothetical protein [Herbinix sp.]
MKKKIVMIGVIGTLFVIGGICYSFTYHKRLSTSDSLVASLNEQNGDGSGEVVGDSALEEASDEEPGLLSGQDGTGTVDNSGNKNSEQGASETESVQHDIEAPDSENTQLSEEAMIFVHLCGAVEKPDVYLVKEGARLIELIKLAGGLTTEAASDYINQAQVVLDGQRIYIPTQVEVKELKPETYITETTQNVANNTNNVPQDTNEHTMININVANEEELMELPGIGKAKAKSIIEYRNKNGDFKRVEDLMNIPGIKEGLYNQLVSYITVD